MSDNAAVGPIETGARIGAMDLLRGVAVCGILLMNIPAMGLPRLQHGRPPLPVTDNADWIAYTIQNIGFAGSMRGLFTLLFGAGMMIMLRQSKDDPVAPSSQAYFVRCFGLMLLGVANFALFMWPGEILFNYGVAGLIVYQFRRANVRVLLTAAAALLITMSIAMGNMSLGDAQMLRKGEAAAAAEAAKTPLTEEQKGALEARKTYLKEHHPTPAAVKEEVAERTSFPGLLGWSAKVWNFYNLSPMTLVFVAESVGTMLLGVALFRLNVLGGGLSLRVYALMAACGYGFGLAVRGFEHWSHWRVGFEPDPSVLAWQDYVYELGRVPVTLGLLGLVLTLHKMGALRWLEGGLKAIGRLALTNYIGQSVITSILFYGFGTLGQFGFAQLMGICVLVWIFQGLLSLAWLSRWEIGPAEWFLRSLTYGRLQPLGRAAALRPASAAHPAE